MNKTFFINCWFWLKVLLVPAVLLALMFVFGYSAEASAGNLVAAMGIGVAK